MISFEPLYKTLGRKDLKLKDLAELMGITYVSLYNLISNPNMSVSQIERICNVLNCKIEEVIEDDGQYEVGWESILGEIVKQTDPDGYRFQRYLQDHPWLKGFDYKSAREILFPV